MKSSPTWLVRGFFAALFALGALISDDFGIGWDEPMHRQQGRRMFEYVTEGNPRGVEHHMRYHGPIVDTTLYVLERMLGLEDAYDVYRMRHFCYFLIFFCGVYFFFRLVERFWGATIGLVGATFLVASPRIFADSFYNPKDIPCLALFIVSFYTMVRYLEQKTVSRAALHALATALLLAIRTVGILIPVLTAGMLLFELACGRKPKPGLLRASATFLLYLGLAAGLTVLFWPTLWRDPLFHATRAFAEMSRYEGWPGKVLYFGAYVSAEALPWHYIPAWISISTPTSYLILGVVGCVVLLKRISENPFEASLERVVLLAVGVWLLAPLLAIVLLESVVYDSWRHAFFVYPALVLLALSGLTWLLRRPRWRAWTIGLVTLDLAATTAFLVVHHPHQNAYFNPLVRVAGGAEGRFDVDYWGVSYRAGLEHVLAREEGPVRVAVGNSPGVYNANLLPRSERERLIFEEDPSRAEYFLTNFRFSPELSFDGDEVFSVRVSGNRVLSVFRSRDAE